MPPLVTQTQRAETDTALKVDRLSVSYGKTTALDDVSFDVKCGEVLGLLGPNGAGKTTLIKSICGQITPSRGKLTLNDRPIRRGAENRKAIGLMPQDIGLYSHMSAAENLDVFARIYGLRANVRRSAVAKALETVGLTQRAHDPVAALSGGMKRRINYAAAILHTPALLILDEPTAGVDIPARDSIHAVTKQLTKRGMAIILVTHEMEAAEHICDRVLMLASGKKHALDTPQNVLTQTFGAQRYSYVTFEGLSEVQSKALIDIGFYKSENEKTWQCALDDDAQAMSIITQALGQAGLSARTLTFKKPTLSDLMHHLESTNRKPQACELQS